MKVISAQNSKNLAKQIASLLRLELVPVKADKFASGELNIEVPFFKEDVLIVASTYPSIHESLFEIAMLSCAAKTHHATKVILLVPYLAYSRQDSMVFRSILACLKRSGIDHIITLDLHNCNNSTFLTNISSVSLMNLHLRDKPKADIIFPVDLGRLKFAQKLSRQLKISYGGIKKKRIGQFQCKSEITCGDASGKNVLLVDDIIDTGSSLIEAVRVLKENGARRVDSIVTHGLFTGDALERIKNSDTDTLTITDSLNNILPGGSGIAIIGIAEYISGIINKRFIV